MKSFSTGEITIWKKFKHAIQKNIGVGKTKVMVFGRNDSECTVRSIMIGDEKFQKVNEFVYLGYIFTKDDKREDDVERRVEAEKE